MQVRFKQIARDRGYDPDDPSGIDETTAAAIGAYGALADAPSLLVSAAIDDAFGTALRPNIPSTIDEWPNWRIPLPGTMEDLRNEPRAAAIATAIGWGRRAEARAPVEHTTSR
jgi:4-alpha-glucanotransferase